MPELPEAETIARGLRARIAGRRIAAVRVHRAELVEPVSARSFVRALRGRRVEAVGRRAKWITITLDDGRRWVTQLRMTGTFLWCPEAANGGARPEERHLSMTARFDDDGGILRFYDVRRFGRMRVLTPEAWAALDARLGPEPLADEFTPERLADALRGSRAPLRNALLDQRRIAGVGNVYANEACFFSGVDPRWPAGSLTGEEVERLHGALREVLGRAIDRGGTSFSDYRDADGTEGSFQQDLAVYGRAGEPCRVCGAAIERAVLAGRSAFFCPSCQLRRRARGRRRA